MKIEFPAVNISEHISAAISRREIQANELAYINGMRCRRFLSGDSLYRQQRKDTKTVRRHTKKLDTPLKAFAGFLRFDPETHLRRTIYIEGSISEKGQVPKRGREAYSERDINLKFR